MKHDDELDRSEPFMLMLHRAMGEAGAKPGERITDAIARISYERSKAHCRIEQLNDCLSFQNDRVKKLEKEIRRLRSELGVDEGPMP